MEEAVTGDWKKAFEGDIHNLIFIHFFKADDFQVWMPLYMSEAPFRMDGYPARRSTMSVIMLMVRMSNRHHMYSRDNF